MNNAPIMSDIEPRAALTSIWSGNSDELVPVSPTSTAELGSLVIPGTGRSDIAFAGPATSNLQLTFRSAANILASWGSASKIDSRVSFTIAQLRPTMIVHLYVCLNSQLMCRLWHKFFRNIVPLSRSTSSPGPDSWFISGYMELASDRQWRITILQ